MQEKITWQDKTWHWLMVHRIFNDLYQLGVIIQSLLIWEADRVQWTRRNGDKAVKTYLKVFSLYLSGWTEEQTTSWKLVSWLAEVCVDTSQMQVRSNTTQASFFGTWSGETIKVKVKFPPVQAPYHEKVGDLEVTSIYYSALLVAGHWSDSLSNLQLLCPQSSKSAYWVARKLAGP